MELDGGIDEKSWVDIHWCESANKSLMQEIDQVKNR